jgi:malonyl-CoA O-methyltransferase
MTQRNPGKSAIRQAFGAAAASYDAVADVQGRIVAKLINHCPQNLQGRILDAGCGTGNGARLLAAHNPQACILGLDAALGMCRTIDAFGVACGDIETLPIRPATLAMYWSSLAWQWTSPALAAAEAFRTLQPGGQLRVATLGPQTMSELRQVFKEVDGFPHVREFDSAADCESALHAAGFTQIRLQAGKECGYFADLATLMRSIRQLGAHVIAGRRQGLLGRQAWARLSAAYEEYRTPGGLPVSHDVIYLSAQKE